MKYMFKEYCLVVIFMNIKYKEYIILSFMVNEG